MTQSHFNTPKGTFVHLSETERGEISPLDKEQQRWLLRIERYLSM